jgi:hypothetical protein
MLPQALEVIAAWGFCYVSHWVSEKDRIGHGYWSRNVHELLLIGTRGNVSAPLPDTQVESIIQAPHGSTAPSPRCLPGSSRGCSQTCPSWNWSRGCPWTIVPVRAGAVVTGTVNNQQNEKIQLTFFCRRSDPIAHIVTQLTGRPLPGSRMSASGFEVDVPHGYGFFFRFQPLLPRLWQQTAIALHPEARGAARRVSGDPSRGACPTTAKSLTRLDGAPE